MFSFTPCHRNTGSVSALCSDLHTTTGVLAPPVVATRTPAFMCLCVCCWCKYDYGFRGQAWAPRRLGAGDAAARMPLRSPLHINMSGQWCWAVLSVSEKRGSLEEVAAAGQTASGCRAGQIHSEMWRKIKMDESSGRRVRSIECCCLQGEHSLIEMDQFSSPLWGYCAWFCNLPKTKTN